MKAEQMQVIIAPRGVAKTGQDLEQFLQMMRKHSVVQNKKGKGSFTRHDKHRNRESY